MKSLKLSALGLLLVLAACSENTSSMQVPIPNPPKDDFSQKPSDFTVFNPRVDILFVVDDSGSMQAAQQNLSRNAYMFAEAISKTSILDFHIGVVSTTMEKCGGVYGKAGCGELQGIPKFVTKSSPNLVQDLSRRLVLGTNSPSGTEEMFSPVMAALSNPLLNGVNAGFYRPEAYLAVIFITDAAEQSSYSPVQFLNFLSQLKGDASKVLGYGVIRTVANKDICESMERVDGKLEEFFEKVSNGDKKQSNILDLCEPSYGKKLAEFAEDIVKRSSGRVRLNRVPNVKTIKVTYGSQVIPNDPEKGWVFEPSTNSIVLSQGIDWQYQGLNVGLVVDFEVIDVGALGK